MRVMSCRGGGTGTVINRGQGQVMMSSTGTGNFSLENVHDYNILILNIKVEELGSMFCYNSFKCTSRAALCIMHEANRIPLEQYPLRDFPIIKFHFEYKHRFLFIANIHSIMLKSLACGYLMRMRETEVFVQGTQ